MGKKKRRASSKNDVGSTIKIAVLVTLLIIGVGALSWAIGTQSTGGGGAAQTQSQTPSDISSLENNVKTLTDQVKTNPKDPVLHENLGTALFNLASAYKQSNDSRMAEALAKTIQVYNETIKLEPGSKETFGDLATAYFYTGQVDKAISTVQQALKLDPTFAPALVNYGIYLGDGKGDYVNAIKQLEKVPTGTIQYDQAQSIMQDYKKALSSGGSSPQ